jgi:hypothetical protein
VDNEKRHIKSLPQHQAKYLPRPLLISQWVEANRLTPARFAACVLPPHLLGECKQPSMSVQKCAPDTTFFERWTLESKTKRKVNEC